VRDRFAVIIAALLLIAALVRWSSKLFISDPAAIGPGTFALVHRSTRAFAYISRCKPDKIVSLTARVTDMAADDYMISGGMVRDAERQIIFHNERSTYCRPTWIMCRKCRRSRRLR
jgi:hypothetical protein